MGHIFVATDNPQTAALIGKTLRRQGHWLTVAQDAIDAWKKAQGHYDVIVLDVMMPHVDSFMLTRRLLIDNPYARIVFVTGFSAIAVEHQGEGMPPTHHLHLRDLPMHIGHYLSGHDAVATTAPHGDAAVRNNVVYPVFGGQGEFPSVSYS